MVASVGAAGVGEHKRYGYAPDDGGDAGQSPDSAPGRERPGVKHAEVLGSLVVLSHGIGYPGAGVHAAQRGPDESQEHSERFSQHEVLAMTRRRAARRRR